MTVILHRRGLSFAWADINPVLRSSEIGYETDTGKFKFGNGVSRWIELPYAAGGDSYDDTAIRALVDGLTAELEALDTRTAAAEGLLVNVVTIDTVQEITGAKAFSESIQVHDLRTPNRNKRAQILANGIISTSAHDLANGGNAFQFRRTRVDAFTPENKDGASGQVLDGDIVFAIQSMVGVGLSSYLVAGLFRAIIEASVPGERSSIAWTFQTMNHAPNPRANADRLTIASDRIDVHNLPVKNVAPPVEVTDAARLLEIRNITNEFGDPSLLTSTHDTHDLTHWLSWLESRVTTLEQAGSQEPPALPVPEFALEVDDYSNGFIRIRDTVNGLADGQIHIVNMVLATTAGPGGTVIDGNAGVPAAANPVWFDRGGALGYVDGATGTHVNQTTLRNWVKYSNPATPNHYLLWVHLTDAADNPTKPLLVVDRVATIA